MKTKQELYELILERLDAMILPHPLSLADPEHRAWIAEALATDITEDTSPVIKPANL